MLTLEQAEQIHGATKQQEVTAKKPRAALLRKQQNKSSASEQKPGERPTWGFGEALDTGFGTGFGSTLGGLQQINSQIADLMRSDISKGPVQPRMGDYLANLLSRDKEVLAKEAMARESNYEAAAQKSGLGALLGNILGAGVSTAPLAAIPGLGQLGLAGRLASSAPGRAALVGGRGALEGGLAAGAQYTPEGQSRLEQSVMGSLFGGGIGGTLAGGAEGLRKANLPAFFRGKLSPEELMARSQAAGQTQIPLGEIIDNPFMKGVHENVLMKMPLSGGVGAAQKTSADIENQGRNLLKEITGRETQTNEDVGLVLSQGLKQVDEQLEEIKRKNYSDLGKEAKKLGIEIEDKHFPEKAKQFLSEIDKDKKLKSSFSPEIRAKLEQYSDFSGNKSSFNDENIFRGDIGDLLREAKRNRDGQGKRVYSGLLSAIDDDINEAIEKSGSDTFKSQYREAQDFYKNEIVPLQDALIGKYAHGKGDTDTLLSAFLKPSKGGQEQKNVLEKITQQLGKSEDSKELMNTLRYGAFAPALEGNKVNPNKIQEIFEKLGPQQRNLLFQDMPEEIGKLQDFSLLNQMNKGSIKAMSNPATGHANLTTALGLGLPIAGAYGGYQLGEQTNIPGAAFLGSGLGLLEGAGKGPGKYITNKMTSPEMRRNFLNKMMAEELKKTSKHTKAIETGRVSGALSGQEEEKEK